MYDPTITGQFVFNDWAKQKPMNNGKIFYNTWLGRFNPRMSADEAIKRLDYIGKITIEGQEQFKKGWRKAQKEHKRKF